MIDFLGVTEHFSAFENTPLNMRWAFVDDDGNPAPLDGVLFTGSVYIRDTDETIQIAIGKSPVTGESHVVIIEIPELKEGRWPYEIWAESDSGERNRVVSGSISVIAITTAKNKISEHAERTCRVTLPGDTSKKLRLEWLASSLAVASAQISLSAAERSESARSGAIASQESASKYAKASQSSAEESSLSASQAVGSAAQAASDAFTANTAKVDAESAKTKAESAKSKAETAKASAETSADMAARKAMEASASASASAGSAATATQKATEAKNAVNSIGSSVSTAQSAATTATSKATEAATFTAAAGAKAGEANTSAIAAAKALEDAGALLQSVVKSLGGKSGEITLGNGLKIAVSAEGKASLSMADSINPSSIITPNIWSDVIGCHTFTSSGNATFNGNAIFNGPMTRQTKANPSGNDIANMEMVNVAISASGGGAYPLDVTFNNLYVENTVQSYASWNCSNGPFNFSGVATFNGPVIVNDQFNVNGNTLLGRGVHIPLDDYRNYFRIGNERQGMVEVSSATGWVQFRSYNPINDYQYGMQWWCKCDYQHECTMNTISSPGERTIMNKEMVENLLKSKGLIS